MSIVKGIATARVNENLDAFTEAIAESLANPTITATGIKNVAAKIATREVRDTITINTLAETSADTRAVSIPKNEALATVVTKAIATAKDEAIAIDNTKGNITRGEAKDTIEATANGEFKAIAIENSQGTINTGVADDTIKANATGEESYGIFGGTVNTANGNDRIEASSFGGGVNINMGNGDDFVEGFGSGTVNGADGFDTLSLNYKFDDFQISLGGNNNEVIFKRDGITMNTAEFEQFDFNNGSFTYDELVAKL